MSFTLRRQFAGALCALLLVGVLAVPAGAISTSASAAVLMDVDSGRVLYSQNANARMLIASTTKIMTALVAIEHGNLSDMIPVIVARCGVDGETKLHSVTREQRRKLEETLRHFTVPVTGPRPVEEAIVTSGGIPTKEINPTTMESKIVKGLYFAGEIMDADAYTGGFNLQIAWATGRAAGLAASGAEAHES